MFQVDISNTGPNLAQLFPGEIPVGQSSVPMPKPHPMMNFGNIIPGIGSSQIPVDFSSEEPEQLAIAIRLTSCSFEHIFNHVSKEHGFPPFHKPSRGEPLLLIKEPEGLRGKDTGPEYSAVISLPHINLYLKLQFLYQKKLFEENFMKPARDNDLDRIIWNILKKNEFVIDETEKIINLMEMTEKYDKGWKKAKLGFPHLGHDYLLDKVRKIEDMLKGRKDKFWALTKEGVINKINFVGLHRTFINNLETDTRNRMVQVFDTTRTVHSITYAIDFRRETLDSRNIYFKIFNEARNFMDRDSYSGQLDIMDNIVLTLCRENPGEAFQLFPQIMPRHNHIHYADNPFSFYHGIVRPDANENVVDDCGIESAAFFRFGVVSKPPKMTQNIPVKMEDSLKMAGITLLPSDNCKGLVSTWSENYKEGMSKFNSGMNFIAIVQ